MSEKPLICQDCGKEGEDVVETTCPFQSEIYNVQEDVILCDDCHHERCMDI